MSLKERIFIIDFSEYTSTPVLRFEIAISVSSGDMAEKPLALL